MKGIVEMTDSFWKWAGYNFSWKEYDISDLALDPLCFPEFEEYINTCKFTSCAHICEKGCAVLQAVKDGEINKSRHNSYVEMYNEVKDIKEWQRK